MIETRGDGAQMPLYIRLAHMTYAKQLREKIYGLNGGFGYWGNWNMGTARPLGTALGTSPRSL
jgi:hypothetical protein